MSDISLLGGTRVLDFGSEALAYAGRILVEIGAEVVLIEPPGGSPLREIPPLIRTDDGRDVSAAFLAYAAGKQSVTIDRTKAGDRDKLDRLVRRAEIILLPEDSRRGELEIDESELKTTNPEVILVSATGFGRTGIRRNWRGSDTVAWAAGGMTFPVGDADRPPVVAPLGLSNAVTSLNACMGSLLALRARRIHGSGQMVDISMQEAVLSVSMEAGILQAVEGLASRRVPRARMSGVGVLTAANGATVDINAFLPTQWDALASWIAEVLEIEEARLDVFRGPISVRAPYIEVINGWITELLDRYTTDEFFIEAQRRGIPCGPVNDLGALLRDEHLRETEAWDHHSVSGLPPFRLPRGPLRVDGGRAPRGTIPRPGEHDNAVLAWDSLSE